MTKRRLVRRRLPADTYNRAITFLYGTLEQINAALPRETGDPDVLHPSTLGRWVTHTHDGREADFLCVVRTGSLDEELPTLAHEALHLTGHVLRTAGVAHTLETEEAYTYYMGWIIRESLKAMRGKR